MRSESRTFELPMKTDGGKQWKVVVETKVENMRRLIYLHSIVQVRVCQSCQGKFVRSALCIGYRLVRIFLIYRKNFFAGRILFKG